MAQHCTNEVTSPSSNIGDITGHWTLYIYIRCTCSTPIIQVNISEICIINKTRVILCLTMYVIFISFCFCFVILASFSLFRTEGFENLQQKELQMANFFFNRRYSLLSFCLPQRILIHINLEALQSPIQYAVFL